MCVEERRDFSHKHMQLSCKAFFVCVCAFFFEDMNLAGQDENMKTTTSSLAGPADANTTCHYKYPI